MSELAGGPLRVALVDDHELVRRGVRDMLESEGDIVVVAEASSYGEAMVRIPPSDATVAVLDVRLGEGDGVELCRDLKSARPDLGCLMLTSFADDDALFNAILAGASGYVLKQIRGAELVDAVRRVGRGESLLDPTMTGRVLARLRRPAEQDSKLSSLTEQERRILDLIAEGLTNRQIGERMHLAEKTVKNYVTNLLSKLGMERRTQAAVYGAAIAAKRREEHPPGAV